MTSTPSSLPLLSLCAAAPRNRAMAGQLRTAAAAVEDWDSVVRDAEWHGVDALLLEHAREHGVELPAQAAMRLTARALQHAHAAVRRAGVVADVLKELDAAGVPAMLLKGAALAHLVYSSARLRPMRDVDLLVPAGDAQRAWQLLRDRGFATSGVHPGRKHHHLQALALVVDDVTLIIEIHSQLLARMPFARPLRYDDVAARSQPVSYPGATARTLAPEDMLWHVYAHAFLVNAFEQEHRLISIADLIAGVETWLDVLDWRRLRRERPRLVRALRRLDSVVPWSGPARRELGLAASDARAGSADWWFDLRYGAESAGQRVWARLVRQPVGLCLAAADVAWRKYA
jgi:hypothetical protein